MKGFWLAIIALQILCSCSLLNTGHSQTQQMHGTLLWSGALGSSTANLPQGCYLAVSDPPPHLHLPFYFHSRLLQSLPDNKYKSFICKWETDLQKIGYLHLYNGQDQALALCPAHQWEQTLQVMREKAMAFAHEIFKWERYYWRSQWPLSEVYISAEPRSCSGSLQLLFTWAKQLVRNQLNIL